MIPYPEYNPSYTVVPKLGGYDRTCLVLEILSESALSGPQVALIQEHLEAALKPIVNKFGLERINVIPPGRFTTQLQAALRLPNT